MRRICPTCGDDDIRRMVLARWDFPTQQEVIEGEVKLPDESAFFCVSCEKHSPTCNTTQVERPAFFPSLWGLPFNEGDHEEITNTVTDPDWQVVYENGEVVLLRRQWVAVMYMLEGKAARIDSGRFDMGDDDDKDLPVWADQLRRIAHTIEEAFPPGDGRY